MDRYALLDRTSGESCRLASSGISPWTLHRLVIFRDHCIPSSAKKTTADVSLRLGDIHQWLPVNQVPISLRGLSVMA